MRGNKVNLYGLNSMWLKFCAVVYIAHHSQNTCSPVLQDSFTKVKGLQGMTRKTTLKNYEIQSALKLNRSSNEFNAVVHTIIELGYEASFHKYLLLWGSMFERYFYRIYTY